MDKNQGLTFCRKDKRGVSKLQKTSKKYCDVCGRKRRGNNHDAGKFHQQRLDEQTKPE
jgi:hypothetical protein